MEKIAEQITEGLIQNLPEESSFYTPEDLLSAGVPAVVVETLRRNIAGTIESGMNLPESDWVDTGSGKVIAAWEKFVSASKRHIKIPSSKISNLMADTVEKCLKLTVKPRQSVPEFIFKNRDTIDLDSAKKSIQQLTINQQLGYALLRYMEKKEKTELSLEQAQELIKKIDDKLIEDYHPLKWANTLRPLFDVAGPAVESELLRIFFEDKEMYFEAKKFDLLEKEVDETEFIEIMSSAELLDAGSESRGQPQLFEMSEKEGSSMPDDEPREAAGSSSEQEKVEPTQQETEPETQTTPSKKKPPTDEVDSDPEQEAETEEIQEIQDSNEPETEQENIVDLFSQIEKEKKDNADLYYLEKKDESESSVKKSDKSETGEDNITLLNKFVFDESVSDESAESEEFADDEDLKEPSSIYEEMNLVKENRNRAERMSDIFDTEPGDTETDEPEDDEPEVELSYKVLEVEDDETAPSSAELHNDREEKERDEGIYDDVTADQTEVDDDIEEEEDDLPMWRSFLERDDIETESGFEYEEETDSGPEEDELSEDGFIEEPIYDLTAKETDPEERLQEISKWLNDERDRFIEEIFSNSEMAYEQALLEIMDFNDWKSASHYLEKEIFSRNKIDVYDEAAVDFTDRLHSYFMQNK